MLPSTHSLPVANKPTRTQSKARGELAAWPRDHVALAAVGGFGLMFEAFAIRSTAHSAARRRRSVGETGNTRSATAKQVLGVSNADARARSVETSSDGPTTCDAGARTTRKREQNRRDGRRANTTRSIVLRFSASVRSGRLLRESTPSARQRPISTVSCDGAAGIDRVSGLREKSPSTGRRS